MGGKVAGWAKQVGEKAFPFHQLNIGPRLTLGFLLIIVVLLVGNGILVWQFLQARSQASLLSGADQELITVLQAHAGLTSFYEKLDLLAQSENTEELVKDVEVLRNGLFQDSQRTRNALNHLPPEVEPDPALLPTLVTIQGTLPAELQSIAVLAKSKDWEAVRLRLANQIRPLESRSTALVENIDREVAVQRAQAVSNIERAQARILFLVPVTAGLTLLFAGFLGLAITRSITQPLGRLMEGTSALARGDFSHRVPAAGKDEIARLGTVFNDMTLRLQNLYRELQRRENYLAEAQKLSHTGSFGWDVSSGEIHWSQETFRIFEYEPTAKVTIEMVVQRTHPEDKLAVLQAIENASRNRTEFDLEHRLIMPNGFVKYLHVVGRPSTDESGRFEFLGAVTDVTERRRAEQERQQLVDFVPQIVSVLSADGQFIHANRVAREYTGLTLDEYLTVDVLGRVIHPDDLEKMRALRRRGISLGGPFEIEARTLGKDGVYRWFLYRYNPLVEHGSVRRWYATGTEIESRKREEVRVRNENVRLEERTRIAQEIHDTLLQSFLGASMQLGAAMDSLPSDSLVKPKLDEILQLMEQGIEEGRKTIEGLRSSDPRTSDLVLALSGVQKELGVQDVDFRVSVAGRQQPLRPPIRQEIYRIGREALVNAFCHSGARRIDFELEYTDSNLNMRVRDNGCGIDPQVLEAGRDGHWGLTGMRERAMSIGGQLKISSSTTAGTEVQLCVPSSLAFQLPATDHNS